MSDAATELYRGIAVRSDALASLIEELRGPLGRAPTSLGSALDLVAQFPEALQDTADRDRALAADAASQVQMLSVLLRHANFVADFLDQHLSHGTHRELSQAVVAEITEELRELKLPDIEVVLSHGEAYNFTTKFGDLRSALFKPLRNPKYPSSPPMRFAFFRVPRIEGTGVEWRPLLLGHEVSHVVVRETSAVDQFDLRAKFDVAAAARLSNPRGRGTPASIAMGLYRIAEAWCSELLCDMQSLRRYGPAAVSALAEYFITIGAMDRVSATHPPGVLRLRLLLNHLGGIRNKRLAGMISPWRDYCPASLSFSEPWVEYLGRLFLARGSELLEVVDGFPTSPYLFTKRTRFIEGVADRFDSGVPGRIQLRGAKKSPEIVSGADVVNACWLARAEGSSTPIGLLGRKALEDLAVVNRWVSRGGQIPEEVTVERTWPPGDLPDEAGVAVLSDRLILQRLQSPDERALVVTPLLHLPKGAGLDLRLGSSFIVFRRTGTTSFDPLNPEDDPRAIQVHVELAPDEKFVLHPQEVVLGATLEFLVLPSDLTGQVITRSSYGRLGLLSATAVQIHPGFHGCLTLELVNLSTIPISLTPGERIAQLVLWRTAVTASSVDKYSCPIGPQFSRVHDDADAPLLRPQSNVP